jgi:DNA-binding NarL/FixJ family response regulator
MNGMEPVPVLFVDTNTTFLRIATRLLEDYYSNDVTVVGTACTFREALSKAEALKPRIVLLGVSQYSLQALNLIPPLRSILEGAGIIVLGSLDIEAYRQAALASGADGFIGKIDINRALVPTIQQVLCAAKHPPCLSDGAQTQAVGTCTRPA